MDVTKSTIENEIIIQCRICLVATNSENDMNCLFEPDEDGIIIADVLNAVAPIEVDPNDSFPKNVCFSCTAIIIEFHNLIVKYKESETYLKVQLGYDSLHDIGAEEEYYNESSNEFYDEGEVMTYDDKVRMCQISDHDHSFYTSSFSMTTPVIKNEITNTGANYTEIAKESESLVQNNLSDAIIKTDEEFLKSSVPSTDIQEEPYQFGVSPKISSDLGQLGDEMIVKAEKFSCETCGDTFLIKSGFGQHMIQKHNFHIQEDQYENYSTKILLKIPVAFPQMIKFPKHKSYTRDVNNLQCRICQVKFMTSDDLKEHMQVHKTHICEHCGAAFLKKYYLYDHLVVHSERTPYVCNICGKRFKHRHSLSAHKNRHKDSRDYVCETCGQSFKDRNTLRTHIKLKHTDERNFPCTHCDLSFKIKSWRDKHFMRKHSDERTRNFVCAVCGIAYLNKTTLTRHITDKHSAEGKIHACNICRKTFSMKGNVLKHLRNVHGVN